MTGEAQERRVRDWPLTIAGALMVIAGGLGLAGLFYISDSGRPLAEHILFGLGLAGSALASVFAQVLIAVGCWLIWIARRRQPGR